MDKKSHYYLVSGEIMYKHPAQADAIGNIRLNTMLQLERNIIRHRELGMAQQMLQLHFRNRVNDELIEVVDVFIFAISYLGLMTESEFQLAPEGQQEKAAGVPTPIANELN